MIIAGAGGHGLEVRSSLISMGIHSSDISFFDQDKQKKYSHPYSNKIISDELELVDRLKLSPDFSLGVGSPKIRKKLFDFFTNLGGKYYTIRHSSSIDQSEQKKPYDLFPFAFIGPQTIIGKATFVNTRAHIHHECQIGEFCEIGPGAIILGNVKIGNFCRIGAGAVLLPGIEIGDEVVIGAGAAVTKSWGNNLVIKGIPAKQ